MGTRADFYVRRGTKAEWIGSIAFDGFPDQMKRIAKSKTTKEYRGFVAQRLSEEDGITPDLGWPWPWADSRTTDFAYAWDRGGVWCSCFGSRWVRWDRYDSGKDEGPFDVVRFPNMESQQRFTIGKRSGLLICALKPLGLGVS